MSMHKIKHSPVRKHFVQTASVAVVVILVSVPGLFAAPVPQEANIARITAALLEQSHFAARKPNGDLSARFLDRYVDSLDGARMYFLQSDMDEFAAYRENLAELTLKKGDYSAAPKIFDRFIERLEQRVAFVKETLQNEKFDFTVKEQYLLQRDKEPHPANLDAAKELWRKHLKFEYLQEKLNKKQHDEIVQTLTKRYERTLRMTKQLAGDQVFDAFLNALARVYDPHSDYMGKRQLEEFSMSMRLSLFGIGAVLRFDDGYCRIQELLPGGPAEASKQIKPGDRVVAVAQDGKEPVDIIEMPLSEAVQLIRGPKGTKVTLTLIPADAPDTSTRKTLTLVRDEIKLEKQQAKAQIIDLPGTDDTKTRIGIIDLPSFYIGDGSKDEEGRSGCTADVAKLIEKLKKENVQGIALDLRRNGGGSLDEAIALTGLFIPTGPVVQTKDANGNVNASHDPDPGVLYDGPLVVLTSRVSASASEILAGALQDYGRALIVGDASTFGKGTVQSMIELKPLMQRHRLDGGENPGALKLTIRKFYRPNGSSTQLKGIGSDLVLPSPLAALKIGESEMSDALPWDEVRALEYTNLNRVTPFVAALHSNSLLRIQSDQEFVWLREDIERSRKLRENPVISLNEEERLKETAEQKERDEARNVIRSKRPPTQQVQYEITLKNVATDGLPEPVSTVGTNLTASVESKTPVAGQVDDDEDEPKAPAVDAILEEAKHILADYIGMLKLAATPPPSPETAQTSPVAR
jgi:carboxyl-terminal processing protease